MVVVKTGSRPEDSRHRSMREFSSTRLRVISIARMQENLGELTG
jgi:hypothetical protein